MLIFEKILHTYYMNKISKHMHLPFDLMHSDVCICYIKVNENLDGSNGKDDDDNDSNNHIVNP